MTDWKIWQEKSTNRRIFSGMLIVAIMTLIVKVVGATKELAVADYFGTSEVVDAFLFAYLLPSFLINVLAGSFGVAIMPAYIGVRDNKGLESANKLFSSFLLIGLLLLLISSVILALFAPELLALLGSGFNGKTIVLTQQLFYWLLPIIVLTGSGQLFATVINASERFAIVALAPAIPPICSVIALIFLSDQWGIHALVAGVVVGSSIELLIFMLIAMRRKIPILPRWYGMTEPLKKVIGQYTPMIAGAFLMSSTALVDQSMAAMLEPGSVATLNYANKVTAMILGIGAMALGTVVLPHFSRLIAEDDRATLRDTFFTYTRLILFLVIPITALLFYFSEPIIKLLFERGAFTPQDTELVAQVQAYYLMQLPFYLLGILGVRLISSLAKNEILMKIAIVNLIVNIIGNYLLMPYFGVAGIALSTSVVYLLSTAMIFYFLYNKSLFFYK